MNSIFSMGLYGYYVWSSFALAVIVLLICYIRAKVHFRKNIKTVEENIKRISEVKNTSPEKLTACVLKRPRHNKIVNSLEKLGVNIHKQLIFLAKYF
jgi:heme exporter protein CcmD